jgi:hypothetical protein
LATYRDKRCKHDHATIAKALTGHWRAEHLGPAGAFAQKHTVLYNVLSDNRLHGQKIASESTDFLVQGLF